MAVKLSDILMLLETVFHLTFLQAFDFVKVGVRSEDGIVDSPACTIGKL